jgi:hypothetical protein
MLSSIYALRGQRLSERAKWFSLDVGLRPHGLDETISRGNGICGPRSVSAGKTENVTPDNNANRPINTPTGKALVPAACLSQCMFFTNIIEPIHTYGRLQF